MKIIRVFITKTNATPVDELVRINEPPGLFDEADQIHISVLFSWDRKRADELAKQWEQVAPVQIGGPGVGMKGEEFTPGMYVKNGYTITSRGCPNKCWFCSVWKRDGDTRELPIMDGYNILDDNLLACSRPHIESVFEMLKRQKEPIEFTGGFEAKRFEWWHINLLRKIRLKQVWFAYDTEDDLEPLRRAGKMFGTAGMNRTKTGNVSHKIRCYCLIGYPGDTIGNADLRLRTTYSLGFLPMAMLYRDVQGKTEYEWRRFQKHWARPASINRICKDSIDAYK